MKTITLRIPEDLHEKVKELSDKEFISWNSKALQLLEQSLKADTTSAHDGTEKH